jgi:type I restriction enzyme, S subunit
MNMMTEWRPINLGKLEKENCLLMRNGFPCGSNNQHERGVPQLRPMNIDNFGEIELSSVKFVETDKNIEIYLIRENNIIFNNTNSKDLVGKTAIWRKESNIYVLSNHMTLLRFNSNCSVDPEFISKYFYLLWLNNYFQRVRRQHVNQASISLERLRI